jgi:hypothetical protein
VVRAKLPPLFSVHPFSISILALSPQAASMSNQGRRTATITSTTNEDEEEYEDDEE